MDVSNHCITKLLSDVFAVFSNGYTDCAELIASTLLAKYGLYNITQSKANGHTVHKFLNATRNLQQSYVWSDMRQVSELLRCTFLYRTTYESSQCINTIDDLHLNRNVKAFKQSLVGYILKHGAFLSYCDIEHVGVFMYTNPQQALTKDIFLECYNVANKDLHALYKQHQGKLPKVVLSAIEFLRTIIDVREINGEELVISTCDQNIPSLPKYDLDEIHSIINKVDTDDLASLHKSLEAIYTQCAHINALASLQWLITIQGENPCTRTLQPIQHYLSQERMDIIKTFYRNVSRKSTPIMLQDVLKLPFIKRAVSVVNDNKLLSKYTLRALGHTAEVIIGNVTKLYLKNIKMLVFADLLFLGYYDVLHTRLMPNHTVVKALITKAERDLKSFDQTMLTASMLSIGVSAIRSFNTGLKKMKRFHKWLVSVQTDEDDGTADALAMLFGDTYDHDGNISICPICFDDAREKRDTWWKLNPCGHKLHLECFDALCATNHRDCPLCRTPIIA